MTYIFKGATRPTEESEAMGAYLQSLRREDGRLYTCDVVRTAREEDCVAHKCFQWDDALAADAHRLDQARKLITSVELVREAGEDKHITMPAFTHLRADRNGYRETEEVYAVPELRSSLVVQLKTDWLALKSKHDEVISELAEFDKFDEAVDAL